MSRPYIIVKTVSTVDGRIAISPNINMWEEVADERTKVDGAEGMWKEFENNIGFLHSPQADMLGSSSIVKEGEELEELPAFDGDKEALYQDFLPEEIVKNPNLKVWLIAVDGRGRLRSGYRGEEASGHYMIHLVSHGVCPEYLAFLQRNKIPYLISGENQVELKAVMEKLRAKLGVERLVTSAGGRLSGALLRSGLIDEVNIIIKPLIYGGWDTPSLFDCEDLKPHELPARLKLISSTAYDNGHVWLRYKVE
jgi:2,5-diamino-6-(ribosylamino)-4(3H)-pyrimidinone 5'-phosphate reductase